MHKVVRRIQRPDAESIKILKELGTATISEAQGRRGLLNTYMRPIYPAARVCGPAITALCQPGDNMMIHAAIEVAQPGDVLVVAVTSPSTDGYFGELLGTSLQAHGVLGLILDAGCRDVAELTAMDFPVGPLHFGAGNGEGDRWFGEYSGGVRESVGASRRCDHGGCGRHRGGAARTGGCGGQSGSGPRG